MGAMGFANSEIVTKLIEYGASIDSVDVMGNGVLMFASTFGRPKNIQCWLERFKDYDTERKNTVLGATPLIVSVNMGSNKIDTVRVLCQNGARVDSLTHAGFSVLMAACA